MKDVSKIKLVIFDFDQDYLQSLVNFMLSHYEHRFEIRSFSHEECLKEYLCKQKDIDVLIIPVSLWQESELKKEIHCLILLSEGVMEHIPSGISAVTKYQKADQLVKAIIQSYSESQTAEIPLFMGNKNAQVISIYSPIGGVGKTVSALGLSMQTSWEGKSVFYLNLESISSSSLFLAGQGTVTLSHLLYYLKQKKTNLSLKIDTAKCIEPKYRIHYFTPADSVLDFSEITADELQRLIKELKFSGHYDRIIIDLSCHVDHKLIAIFKASDQILLISTARPIDEIKIKAALKDIALVDSRNTDKIMKKIRLVINELYPNERYKKDEEETQEILGVIPFVPKLIIAQEDGYRIDMNSAFGQAMYNIMTKL